MNEQTPAGFWERAGALGIDAALFVQAQGMLIFIWGLAVSPFGGAVSSPFWPWSLVAEGVLVVAALACAYRWKRSPAMAILSLELVDSASGERPSFWRCLVRAIPVVIGSVIGFLTGSALLVSGAPHGQFILGTLYFWVPMLALAAFLLTYAPMVLTSRRQSLWDVVSRTRVVKLPKVPGAITAYR